MLLQNNNCGQKINCDQKCKKKKNYDKNAAPCLFKDISYVFFQGELMMKYNHFLDCIHGAPLQFLINYLHYNHQTRNSEKFFFQSHYLSVS